MNQLHDAESGNINVTDDTDGQVSVTGGHGLPPNSPDPNPEVQGVQEPANMNIVNEYNSFNLANVTAPIAPKWKTSETLLDDYCKF